MTPDDVEIRTSTPSPQNRLHPRAPGSGVARVTGDHVDADRVGSTRPSRRASIRSAARRTARALCASVGHGEPVDRPLNRTSGRLDPVDDALVCRVRTEARNPRHEAGHIPRPRRVHLTAPVERSTPTVLLDVLEVPERHDDRVADDVEVPAPRRSWPTGRAVLEGRCATESPLRPDRTRKRRECRVATGPACRPGRQSRRCGPVDVHDRAYPSPGPGPPGPRLPPAAVPNKPAPRIAEGENVSAGTPDPPPLRTAVGVERDQVRCRNPIPPCSRPLRQRRPDHRHPCPVYCPAVDQGRLKRTCPVAASRTTIWRSGVDPSTTATVSPLPASGLTARSPSAFQDAEADAVEPSSLSEQAAVSRTATSNSAPDRSRARRPRGDASIGTPTFDVTVAS